MHQRAGTLSHGMRKRLSIARALLHNPPILLMDEPESGLDQEAQTMLDDVIVDLARSLRAVLMTTHNLERAVAVGNRVAILSGGRIVHHGPVDAAAGVDFLREIYSSHTGVAP